MHRGLWTLVFAGAYWISTAVVKLLNRRAKDEPPLVNTPLPINLKYDPWQTAPKLVVLVGASACIVFISGEILELIVAPARRPLDTGTAGLVLLTLVFVTAAVLYALWLNLFKLFNPDSLTVAANGIELVSGGRIRRWSWQQIADIELRTVQSGSGGTDQIVSLTIPGEAKRTVDLPQFVRSEAGPENVQDICELIRSLLAKNGVRRAGMQFAASEQAVELAQ